MNKAIDDFFSRYNEEKAYGKKLVDLLGDMYEFIYASESMEEYLNRATAICYFFNVLGAHSSELKTALIITKRLKLHPRIKKLREDLMITYEWKHALKYESKKSNRG